MTTSRPPAITRACRAHAFTDKELGHTVTVKFDGNFKNAVAVEPVPAGLRVYEPWNGFPGNLATPDHETLAPATH
jgi:hypothetical protein